MAVDRREDDGGVVRAVLPVFDVDCELEEDLYNITIDTILSLVA